MSSINNEYFTLKLYLGFIMNKLTSLRNINKTKPNMKLEQVPFTFKCDDTPVTFHPAVDPLIKIKVS